MMKPQKGELIAEIHGKLVGTTIQDITQDGIKMQINDVGEVHGKMNGSHMETVTVVQKMDGTNTWQTKGIETTKEGDMLVIQGGGSGKNTSPTESQWTGEVSYMTNSPKLAWLNSTKGWVEGSGNLAKGDFHGKVYAIK